MGTVPTFIGLKTRKARDRGLIMTIHLWIRWDFNLQAKYRYPNTNYLLLINEKR